MRARVATAPGGIAYPVIDPEGRTPFSGEVAGGGRGGYEVRHQRRS